VKIKNVFGTEFRGAIGKSLIASSWKGTEYVKAYAAPSNPRSEEQRKMRGIFSRALEAWRGLSLRQKEFYGRIAEGISGYNLFVRRYIKAVRAGLEPEWPIEMQWRTEDGRPIEDGWLIVQWRSKDIFVDCLADAKGEVALTPSDAPYTLSLKRGRQKDIVLRITDLGETDVPMTLESERLGIKLIADVQRPPNEVGGGRR
jgi:hypothetical protein